MLFTVRLGHSFLVARTSFRSDAVHWGIICSLGPRIGDDTALSAPPWVMACIRHLPYCGNRDFQLTRVAVSMLLVSTLFKSVHNLLQKLDDGVSAFHCDRLNSVVYDIQFILTSDQLQLHRILLRELLPPSSLNCRAA